MPYLRACPAELSAPRYNRVRLALLRLKRPLRLSLPPLRGLDMLLDDEAWVCMDRTLNDLPVLAWTDFRQQARDAIHLPVPCTLRFYHAHAEIIIDTALSEVDCALSAMLAGQRKAPSLHPAGS
jgi:hypothetical protein